VGLTVTGWCRARIDRGSAGGVGPFTAFASQKKTHQIPGRLVVRRIPDLRPTTEQGQGALFDVWRFHAFFPTTDPDDLDTVAADKTHRQHAVSSRCTRT